MITRLALLSLFLSAPACGRCDTPDFPEGDWEARIEHVNEGDLRFLNQPPERPVHHHHNRIRITRSSLEDGWVSLEQCHEHLDPVAATQIVFHPERIRAIRVKRSSGIGHADASGPNIQLQDVGAGAVLCLYAESRALQSLPDGRFLLQNGPYMRRFLDGYYPMRLTLDIHYPSDLLTLEHQEPAAQPGFRLQTNPSRIEADAWFEGRLYTRFMFCLGGVSGCKNPLQ